MTIKELLQNGETPEKLLKDLQDQIEAAQKEIAADKSKEAKAKELADAREGMVYSVLFYLESIGLIEKDSWDEWDVEEYCKMIAKAETDTVKDFEKLFKLRNMLAGEAPKAKSKEMSEAEIDKAIKDFLKFI